MKKLLRVALLLALVTAVAGCGQRDYVLQQQKRELAAAIADAKIQALESEEDLARAVTEAKIQDVESRKELDKLTHNMRMTSRQMDARVLQQTTARTIRLRGDADFDALAACCAARLLGRVEKFAELEARARKNRSMSIDLLLPRQSPILVSSFVNLDDLTESSTFGRMLSDKLAAQFNVHGYKTIDTRLRQKILVQEGTGELMLSRDLDAIGAKHRAVAALVGTYAVGMDKVYVTVRAVRICDRVVLAADNLTIPIGANTFKMLYESDQLSQW